MPAPECCGATARLTDGRETYPWRPELADKPMYACDECGGFVGCHPGTTVALGTPAGPELRRLRRDVHVAIDPLWREAHRLPTYAASPVKARKGIEKRARQRVYRYLADRLGLTTAECHVALFDAARCSAAIEAMRGVTYSEIRAWARRREAAERAALSTAAEEVVPC